MQKSKDSLFLFFKKPIISRDALPRIRPFIDSTQQKTYKNLRSAVAKKSTDSSLRQQNKSLLSRIPFISTQRSKDTTAHATATSLRHAKDSIFKLIGKPAVRLSGGMISYQLNYRSFIDSPFAEKNILQHQVMGRLNATIAGNFPLQVNYWIRRSNSQLFRNIADVQVLFNTTEFRKNIQQSMRGQLLAAAQHKKDSLLEKAYALKNLQVKDLEQILRTKFHPQFLVEANEILTVPKLSWNNGLPDSVNQQKEDRLKQNAALLLKNYEETKQRYDKLKQQADTLQARYQKSRQQIENYKKLVNGQWNDVQTTQQWKNKLKENGLDDVQLPKKHRWLLGVRNFSVGRSSVNYSELTAKNISANGLNFEYNSWYYFAVTAGMVDFRFRDFAISANRRQPQYLAMVRAGIGRLEKNYFILSAFRGRKQLFRSSTQGGSSLNITGVTASSRWALSRNSYITAEVGKSMAPDFRTSPIKDNTSFNLSDKSNQAIALHLNAYIPLTNSRIEAFYKNTGANYQSFSSYTTNAAMESWYIKAEQNLFKRQLRIAGALRKNEFTNPFVLQDYKSNTVFKSLTATLRVRRLPVITVGYQPLSQLTKVGTAVIENRFQSLNATLYHAYKYKQLRMATIAMLNKFYNHQADSAFLYYNATSTYVSQQFFFSSFSAAVGGSYSSNGTYKYQVLDGSIQPVIPKFGSVTVGVKINNLNSDDIKPGGYIRLNMLVFKGDRVTLGYDHGYLPGNRGKLIRNEMGTVQFTKSFTFQ